MKKYFSAIFVFSLIIGCTVDPAPFYQKYDAFIAEYKAKRENTRTAMQYDSLNVWAKEAAGAIISDYAEAGFTDTTLLKLADLMTYAEMSSEAAAAFEKAFAGISNKDPKFISKYIDQLMKGDLSNPEFRTKIDQVMTENKEPLGDVWAQKVLYYGYYLAEKNLKDPASEAFTKVLDAGASASITGQAVLEIAAIKLEEEGAPAALEFLKEKDKTFPENKMILEKIVQYSLIGKKAPELTKVLTMGELKSLASLKGKVVLIDFWAPWCGPCRKVFPEMKALYSEFKDQGFEIIGATNYYPFYRDEQENIPSITEEEYDTKLAEFRARWELTWPFFVAKDKVNRDNYGVSFIPTLFLVDRDGIVRYAQVGSKEDPAFLREKITALL